MTRELEEAILAEVADPQYTRREIAVTYALLLRYPESVDFGAINMAIIDRWSTSALRWIKSRAWKEVEGK